MVCAKERDLIIFTSCLPMDPLIKVFFSSVETIIIRKQVTNLSFTGFFKFTKYFFGKKKQEQKNREGRIEFLPDLVFKTKLEFYERVRSLIP